jgi:hypothetical protein
MRRNPNRHAHPDLRDAVDVSRFWSLVDKRATCWMWTGHLDKDGYGLFVWRGRRVGAHTLALSFTTGETKPEGMDTCHSCDNPPCVNPAHLRFDTRQANVDDAHARGRAAVGERIGAAKLTERDVIEIRTRRAAGALQKHLARDYGVSPAYVSEIVNGITWTQVGGPITGNSKRKAVA